MVNLLFEITTFYVKILVEAQINGNSYGAPSHEVSIDDWSELAVLEPDVVEVEADVLDLHVTPAQDKSFSSDFRKKLI